MKEVGVTSHRKIEETVREEQTGGKKLKVRMTLTAEGTGLNHVVDGEIELSISPRWAWGFGRI